MADLKLTPGCVCPSLTITLTHGTLLVRQYKTYRFAEFHVGEKSNLGSGVSSNYEKKQFTLKSTEFNVKSRVFNELLPHLKQEAKDEIKSTT